jgi:hypothetical protein
MVKTLTLTEISATLLQGMNVTHYQSLQQDVHLSQMYNEFHPLLLILAQLAPLHLSPTQFTETLLLYKAATHMTKPQSPFES